MLRKLMKYEFMAMGRVFLPLFAALIIVSVVNRLLAALSNEIPVSIGIILAVILIAGISVVALLLTMQRFRNNLLSNEGYLMMTLPVSTDRIIISKLLVASVWSIASFLVIMISIIIMAMISISLSDIVDFIKRIFNLVTENPLHTTIYSIEIIIIVLLSIFNGILLLYSCMSLSMLVNKHRGLFTFGAFITITTFIQILASVTGSVVWRLDLYNLLGINDWNVFWHNQINFLTIIIIFALHCTGFYLITRYMLKKRLNIQ